MNLMKDLLVPVEEYLSTNYEPDCEYADGILVERNVGERHHSDWQGRLMIYLGGLEEKLGIHVFPEWRVQVRANRFRVPDLTVVAGQVPGDPILRVPPFLVIEIVSPDDKPGELQRKVADYREFGIPYILLIYPDDPRFVLYTKDGEQDLRDGLLRTEDPAIEISLLKIHKLTLKR